LKFNIFYYAVTGAVLSFYFSNTADLGVPRYLLLVFPVVMSFGFGGFFIYAASLVKVTRGEIMKFLDLLLFRKYESWRFFFGSVGEFSRRCIVHNRVNLPRQVAGSGNSKAPCFCRDVPGHLQLALRLILPLVS